MSGSFSRIIDGEWLMWTRQQKTLSKPVVVSGIAMFCDADVRVSFLPAPADSGIVFERTDLPGSPRIPAGIESLWSCHRRTGLATAGASVAMVEHALAALAGLQIDNCLIQVDGPELPGLDGSSLEYVDRMLVAGLVDLSTKAHRFPLPELKVEADHSAAPSITALHDPTGHLTIRYSLDYGAASPITRQETAFCITPEVFAREIAPARTFVLESEVAGLKKQGYGKRMTARDLLVFGRTGVIDNRLRFPDECARHKILDCLGDFALLGQPLSGLIHARQSGHELNHRFVERALFLANQNLEFVSGDAA